MCRRAACVCVGAASAARDDAGTPKGDGADGAAAPAPAEDDDDTAEDRFRFVARVRLRGACLDCPSSTVTLRFMVRNLLCHRFPGEIVDVVDVAAEDAAAAAAARGPRPVAL